MATIRYSRRDHFRRSRPSVLIKWLGLRLPTDKTLWRRFEREAAALIRALPDGDTVLDLGGGRRCVYASAVEPPGRVRLIAVDISPEELALNEDAAEKYTADVAAGLPLPTSLADLILSRALLEHVGQSITFDPLVRLVHAVMPWTRDHVGFPIYYDSCYPGALEREFLGSGFSEVKTWITWAQPGYFEAILPVVSSVCALRMDNAAASIADARCIYSSASSSLTILTR
jgi:hypothetical protein